VQSVFANKLRLEHQTEGGIDNQWSPPSPT
jgi:hypothetical protein